MLRRTLPILVLTIVSCTATTPAPKPTVSVTTTDTAVDVTDASLLRIEDRREYDQELLTQWASSSTPARRARAAIAIGRIGTATFEDLDGNGWQDENEPDAGTSILLTLTVDPDPAVRAAAAFAFGETGDLRGVEALFALTEDDEPLVAAKATEAISKLVPAVPFQRYETLLSPEMPAASRLMAIRYLFRFAEDRASATAALLLSSPDPEIRREAAYSLNRHAVPRARRQIEKLLDDQDALTRAYAARALGRIADPASIAPLLASAKEPHAWVRTNSIRALGQIIDAEENDLSQDQLSDLAQAASALTGDPDAGTAASAIELLGRAAAGLPDTRAQLEAIAKNGPKWHRELAVLWLARNFGAESVESLSLPDEPWLKIRTVEGASVNGGEEARRRFFEDTNPSVRAAAVGNTPTDLTSGDREIVRAALEDIDPIVRATAIGFVPRAFPDDAIEILRDAEDHARGDVLNDARLSAIDALAEIEFPGRPLWLKGLTEDDDPVVRRAASDHLFAIEGRRAQYTPLPIERSLIEYERIAEWASRPHIAALNLPRGEIRIALRADQAPMTAWNFVRLANQGYFDGTTFMRVVPNFVIQGGDPRNDMSGGPGYAIRDEMNMIEYQRGAVGMALSGPDTGGSQFFVTHSPQPHLDGGYTVFGHVISGRGKIIDQVERGDRITSVSIKEASWTELEIGKVAGVPLPTVVGVMTPDRLMAIVPEYPERRSSYEPNPDVISYMASIVRPEDRIVVALGTWCHDSQREVPRFLKVLDELSAFGVEIPVEFVAVNREKTEPAQNLDGLAIDLVATFVYYRNDEELGRIVETPDGPLEDHLIRIIASD